MHIVITGANRGIGLEFCRQLVSRGDKVTALCRTTSPELSELEVKVVEGFDVRNPPELPGIDGIDWLVLNAGIWRDESIDDLNFETITEQIEVNSLGPLRVFDKLQSSLSDGSKVFLMTSQMGSMADNTSGGRYGYRASKACLNCLGVSLAHDLKGRGIAVRLLHPGYVATDMTQHRGTTSPEDSVSGLLKVMEETDLDNTGSFKNFRGETLPW